MILGFGVYVGTSIVALTLRLSGLPVYARLANRPTYLLLYGSIDLGRGAVVLRAGSCYSCAPPDTDTKGWPGGHGRGWVRYRSTGQDVTAMIPAHHLASRRLGSGVSLYFFCPAREAIAEGSAQQLREASRRSIRCSLAYCRTTWCRNFRQRGSGICTSAAPPDVQSIFLKTVRTSPWPGCAGCAARFWT